MAFPKRIRKTIYITNTLSFFRGDIMKAKEMKNGMMCHHGMCGKCHAGKLLVLGVLVILNSMWSFLDWGLFIGALLVLGGLLKLVKPMCPHCA